MAAPRGSKGDEIALPLRASSALDLQFLDKFFFLKLHPYPSLSGTISQLSSPNFF